MLRTAYLLAEITSGHVKVIHFSLRFLKSKKTHVRKAFMIQSEGRTDVFDIRNFAVDDF